MSDQHIPNMKCGCTACFAAKRDIEESKERLRAYEILIRPLLFASNPIRRML